MARQWEKPMQWNNEGVEPSDTLKGSGFVGGYKPPAGIFNYFLHKEQVCIEELQEAVDDLDTEATDSKAGLMSANDKTKLDGIATGANNYTHPTDAGNKHIPSGGSDGQVLIYGGSSGTAEWGEASGGVGKSLEGQTVSPTSDTTVTAGTGAEIFNDYSDRTYIEGEVYSGNIASGNYSHAEGRYTTASGNTSHAEGLTTFASGNYSHAEGNDTTASGGTSHAEGHLTTASGNTSHAEGYLTTASGAYSHTEGNRTTASGNYSHAEGYYTTAQGYAQHVSGKYNTLYEGPTGNTDSTGSIFIVGNGTGTTVRSNAFRITAAGQCMGTKSFTSSGADYAEYFEWIDGNPNDEDRRGRFVTLDGEKIRIADDTDDYILGVVSSRPSVIGDGFTDQWKGMYLTDVFGEELTETVEVPESTDEETGKVIPAHTETRFILNPEYDHAQEYIGRELRKEWSPVGLVGKLVVVDDGTCEVNGYCKVSSSGGATKSTEKTPYRVMSRLDDKHVRVFIK